MQDIDKIAELFILEQYQLSFQLCDAIGLNKIEMLQYVWDKYKVASKIMNDYDLVTKEYNLLMWYNITSGRYNINIIYMTGQRKLDELDSITLVFGELIQKFS